MKDTTTILFYWLSRVSLCLAQGYRAGKRCLPQILGPPLVFFLACCPPVSNSFSTRASLPAFPAEGILLVWSPAHHRGVAIDPGPASAQPARACLLFPDRGLRALACARAPARGPARRRERALCGRCRHVVVVVRRRRRQRRSSRTRRSSGSGAGPRRPWLGA